MILLIILALFLIEALLLLSWNRPYYRYGIVIFTRKFPVPEPVGRPIDPEFLAANCKDEYVTAMLFRKYNDTECAFRARLWNTRQLSYLPVMRGFIRWDKAKKMLVVTGNLNWYALLFIIFVLLSLVGGITPPWAPPVILFGILVLFIQISRYNMVAEVASGWLQKTAGPPGNTR